MLQYTSFGETWYRALALSLDARPRPGTQIRVAYTLSKAEDTATDFQTAFLPQDNGRGRDLTHPEGCRSDSSHATNAARPCTISAIGS